MNEHNESAKGFRCHDRTLWAQWRKMVVDQKYYQSVVAALRGIRHQPIKKYLESLLIHGSGFDVTDYGDCILTEIGSDMDIQVMIRVIQAKGWKSIDIIGPDEFCVKAGSAAVKADLRLRNATLMQKVKQLDAEHQRVLQVLKDEGMRITGKSVESNIQGDTDENTLTLIAHAMQIGLTEREARAAIRDGINSAAAANVAERAAMSNAMQSAGMRLARDIAASHDSDVGGDISSLKTRALQAGWLADQIDRLIQQGHDAEKAIIDQQLREMPETLRELGLHGYIKRQKIGKQVTDSALKRAMDEAAALGMPMDEIAIFVRHGEILGEQRCAILQEIKEHSAEKYRNDVDGVTDVSPSFSMLLEKAQQLGVPDLQVEQQVQGGANEERKRMQAVVLKKVDAAAMDAYRILVWGLADSMATDARLSLVIEAAMNDGMSNSSIQDLIMKGTVVTLGNEKTEKIVVALVQGLGLSADDNYYEQMRQQLRDNLCDSKIIKQIDYVAELLPLDPKIYRVWAAGIDMKNAIKQNSMETLLFNAGARWAEEHVDYILTASLSKLAALMPVAQKIGVSQESLANTIKKSKSRAKLVVREELIASLRESGKRWVKTAHATGVRQADIDLANALHPALSFGFQAAQIRTIVTAGIKSEDNHASPPLLLRELLSLEKDRSEEGYHRRGAV